MPVDLSGEEPLSERHRVRSGGEAGVVMDPFELGTELRRVPRGVVGSLHHLDERIQGELGQRHHSRRLARLEQLVEPERHLVNPVRPVI